MAAERIEDAPMAPPLPPPRPRPLVRPTRLPPLALALLLAATLCLLPAAVSAGAAKRDPYKVLGVPRTADEAAIQKAYR